MIFIPGYSIKGTIEENGLFLYKAVRDADRLPVIIASARLNNTKQVKQLEHEFELSDQLDPGWSLKPISLERTSDSVALVFEKFDGITLSKFQKAAPVELRQFLHLGILISSALAKLHKAGIIHKDIKPQNILINPSTEEIRIIDFGISSNTASEYFESLTPIDQIEGTLPYMSPEQTGRMNRPLDYRTDMYSLGITFYQMLTGRLPFSAKDPLEWVYNHVARIPQSPHEIFPQIPLMVSNMVMKLISKLAEDRYQSMEGLIHDLQKCLKQLEENYFIEPFLLGEEDYSGKFQITQKIYGREKELNFLQEIYHDFYKSGAPQLVSVSGYSGVGKTMLIHEFRKQLLYGKSFFIHGKFDQSKKDVPYSTVIDLYKELFQILETRPEVNMDKWRQNIQEAVGSNGRVITEVIPDLELFIGKQPDVVALSPTESQNRFSMVFEKFIKVFSQNDHPLVIFLDDVQWADTGTLKLIEKIVTNPTTKFIFFLLAYRNNEVTPSHPLCLTLAKIKNSHTTIKEINLTALRKEEIERIIRDSLHAGSEDIGIIADTILDKTGGNPYFAKQFLAALYHEKLLRFNSFYLKWEWDITRIKNKGYTDNLADLMVKKIRCLDAETQNILKLAACIGNKFDKRTLLEVYPEGLEKIDRCLNRLINEELVSYYNEQYKFLHDQIQEAAYSLIPEKEYAALNLKIARSLLAQFNQQESEQVFDIVNHFNHAVYLITDPEERKLACTLNIQAGGKAKAAAAYTSARNYFEEASKLLEVDSWNTNYETTFLLYLDFSDCEYLVGNMDRALELFTMIYERAHSNPDKATALMRKAELYQVTGNFGEAVNILLDGLRLFGVTFPEAPEEIKARTEAELRDIEMNMRGRKIAELEHASIITDPDIRSIIRLLEVAFSPAYNTKPEIVPLLTCKGMNLTLQHGIVEEACTVFGYYGIIRQGMFEDTSTAFELLELAIRINEKFNDIRRRGTLLVVYGASINFWGRHVASSRPLMEKGFAASMHVGDFLYAGYNATIYVWNIIEEGKTFEYVFHKSEKYFSFARQSQNEVLHYMLKEYNQFLLCLNGLTRDRNSFDDENFSEAKSLEVFKTWGYVPGILWHYIMKQYAAFIYRNYQDALIFSLKADEANLPVVATQMQTTHQFFYALTIAGVYRQASVEKQTEYDKTLDEIVTRHKMWAKNCPENFQNRYALIEAERARIKGKETEAMHLYEEAIRSAKANGFIQHEAIANELAGCFYKAFGLERVAETYLLESYRCFKAWGAKGKLSQMEELYPFLKGKGAAATLGGIPVEQFDLLAMIKASQAISGEMDFKVLIGNLMRIVLQQSGAHKAVLLLHHDDSLVMASQAKNDKNEFHVDIADVPVAVSKATIPLSIIESVVWKKENVILEDVSLPNLFSSDDYFNTNRPYSIASLPIVKQTKLLGILYLENHIFTKAFSPEKISILELLSSQAAISIENANLFKELILSRYQFQDMMDNSPAIIFMKQPDGKYIFVNQKLEKLFQASKEEIIGKTSYDFFPEELANRITMNDQKVLEAGHPITFEETILQEEGRHTYLTVRFPLLDLTTRVPYAICCIATDITDRIRIEEKMKHMNRELIRINTDLDNFIYTASHNLRGPVATIEGLMNILGLNLYKEGELKEIVKMLKGSLAKFKESVSDLTEISKVQKLIEKNDVVSNDIVELIEEMKAEMPEMISDSEAEIKIEQIKVRHIKFSREYLKRIFYNLISNSVKFRSVERKLEIRISTDESHKFIILCIADNAIGISPMIQQKVYSMFSEGYTRGSGIGLYIVKRILDNEGGKMEFSSEEGKGSVFKLYFKK